MPDTPTRDTVYFYKFNNYYNRIIKRYDTIEEYGTPLGTQDNCNFVHGDGVNSSFTMNKLLSLLDTPDYVVVEDYNGDISRWFVINSFKSRSGQDLLTLRRDLIADFYNDVLKYSPCLIRKGHVPQTNPLIFNDEGVKYNKIKQAELLIKDESNCSYIVGFISNNAGSQSVTGTIKDDNYDYAFTDLNAFPLKTYVEGAGNSHTTASTRLIGNENTSIWYAVRFSTHNLTPPTLLHYDYTNYEMTFNHNGNSKPDWYTNTYNSYAKANDNLYYRNYNTVASSLIIDYSNRNDAYTGKEGKEYQTLCYNWQMFSSTNLQNAALDLLGIEFTNYNAMAQYVGKRVKIGNVVYSVSFETENEQTKSLNANNTVKTIMNNAKPFNSVVANMIPGENCHYKDGYTDLSNTDITVLAKTKDYYLRFTESSSDISTTVDSPSNRTHLADQPFDMFVLINESNITYKVGVNSYTSNHDVNMNIAQSIIQAYGDAAYDIQIVPFNPIRGAILADGTINWLNYDSHEIKDSNNNVLGHYILCSSADLKFTLEKDDLKIKPTDYKKDMNLKQYRLCSPNQETVFDLSPSMNDGIETWEITANYRPYASYIKVQPTWNYMYGETSYNELTDFRGLVYNSTLCVTQLNDAWANYVANNKNYQQLFDNQINTLTKSQQIQLNAMEETLGWRSYTGMPISSIARVIGGSKDIEMQRELNNVALSKMETDFKYQMDNIQSMPHTVKKLTNINGDTRVFPYIEVYSASEVDEQSFDLKMRYTGYTIMTTGYIWNYLKLNEETFVQADLIRLDLSRSEETADNHIAIEIAAELEKGVYITKESE